MVQEFMGQDWMTNCLFGKQNLAAVFDLVEVRAGQARAIEGKRQAQIV